jgi:hypothetical protein
MMLMKKDGGLGYKDLHSFNMAMLAKQGWRLLTEPDSLCVRVLKASYYPDALVLHAQPSSGMSYTWRSILRGVELLREGVIKRVGDGVSIDCWRDPWLPRKWDRSPITRKGKRLNGDGCHLFFRCQEVHKVWMKLNLNEAREKLLACDGADRLSLL